MKGTIQKSLLTALFIGRLAVSANAATYYVETWGNDNNPGTSSSPWRHHQ